MQVGGRSMRTQYAAPPAANPLGVITPPQRTALDWKWWTLGRNKSYKHWERIDAIWTRAFAGYYWPNVQKILLRNKKEQNGRPASWAELARRLGIHEKSMPRCKKEVPDSDLRMAISTYVGEEDNQLAPKLNLAVTTATVLLVAGYPPHLGERKVEEGDAYAYATYAVLQPAKSGVSLCPVILGDILPLLSPDIDSGTVSRQILKTAETVGNSLHDHFQGMTPDASGNGTGGTHVR
jgi:hypothetical protein